MGYIAKCIFDIIYTVQLKRLVDIIDNDDNSELLKKVFVVQYSFDPAITWFDQSGAVAQDSPLRCKWREEES